MSCCRRTEFNVARALVGSEGTCAVMLGATLRLVESPPFRTLVGVGFPDVFVAADAVPHVLGYPVIGLEGMDGALLDALRRKQKSLEDIPLLPEGLGFLLAEFGGQTQAEADEKAGGAGGESVAAGDYAGDSDLFDCGGEAGVAYSRVGAGGYGVHSGVGWEAEHYGVGGLGGCGGRAGGSWGRICGRSMR